MTLWTFCDPAPAGCGRDSPGNRICIRDPEERRNWSRDKLWRQMAGGSGFQTRFRRVESPQSCCLRTSDRCSMLYGRKPDLLETDNESSVAGMANAYCENDFQFNGQRSRQAAA